MWIYLCFLGGPWAFATPNWLSQGELCPKRYHAPVRLRACCSFGFCSFYKFLQGTVFFACFEFVKVCWNLPYSSILRPGHQVPPVDGCATSVTSGYCASMGGRAVLGVVVATVKFCGLITTARNNEVSTFQNSGSIGSDLAIDKQLQRLSCPLLVSINSKQVICWPIWNPASKGTSAQDILLVIWSFAGGRRSDVHI